MSFTEFKKALKGKTLYVQHISENFLDGVYLKASKSDVLDLLKRQGDDLDTIDAVVRDSAVYLG